MSLTIEETVSMMEAMPEDERMKVKEYAQFLFTSKKPANPFVSLTEDQILATLAESRRQIANGEGIPAEEVMSEIGKEFGFI
ncbi:MAG: hypothetical protein LUF92_02465 [Clostridiales bacterium]|nr:hypothetical protein [Clostridiales bacterium]